MDGGATRPGAAGAAESAVDGAGPVCAAAGAAPAAGAAADGAAEDGDGDVSSRRSRRRELNQARARAVRSAWAE